MPQSYLLYQHLQVYLQGHSLPEIQDIDIDKRYLSIIFVHK